MPTLKKEKNFGKTPEKQFIFLHHYNWLFKTTTFLEGEKRIIEIFSNEFWD